MPHPEYPDPDLREAVPRARDPLGLDGIEFIEYATRRPQALGRVLEAMGFMPVARHRSREVTLYRQGTMNLIVNAHRPYGDEHPPEREQAHALHRAALQDEPVLAAVAFRVHDAHKAHSRCLALGAWDVPSRVRAMELHIPAIQGPGGSRFYFVDRCEQFSIYDIDFLPSPTADPHPPAVAGTRFFGVVQYIGTGRTEDWLAYCEHLFGFAAIPDEERYGILPKGTLMKSPGGAFWWQLVEPDPAIENPGIGENLERIGIAVADVPQAVARLRARGVQFVDAAELHPDDRGALTRPELGSVAFELVHAV